MSLHVITIPNDLDLTSSAAITKFIDARAITPMMGFEMCAWLDDVYFNNASRTKGFEDGRYPLFRPHTSELADGSPFDTTVSECECEEPHCGIDDSCNAWIGS